MNSVGYLYKNPVDSCLEIHTILWMCYVYKFKSHVQNLINIKMVVVCLMWVETFMGLNEIALC